MSRFSMFTRVALPIALIFVSASLLEAQDQQGRRGRGGRGGFGFTGGRFGRSIDKVTLIRIEQVQKEIKVTEEQKTKIDGILASYREERNEVFGFGRPRAEGDRGQREGGRGRGFQRQRLSDEERAERDKKVQALVAKFEKKVDALLQKPQLKRLNEIALQQKGVSGLTDAPVAASLKLSEKQVGQIKAVFKAQQEAQQKIFEEMRSGGGGREGFAQIREKMQKMREDTDKKALEVLSKEQQERYTALKGKTFELEPGAFGRGFGRGGRGGEGRGGGQRGGGGQRRRPPVDDA